MLPTAFSTLDIVVVFLVALAGLQGLFRGLSGELARMLGALLAFIAGTMLHEPFSTLVANHTRVEEQEARILTFTLTVFASLILLAFFHKLIRRMIALMFSKGFDKLAGVPAGMLRMCALLACLFVALNLLPPFPRQEFFGSRSYFGSRIVPLIPSIRQKLEEAGVPGIPPADRTDPERREGSHDDA